MKNKELVSIIVLAYNQEEFIEEAVTSVLNQEYNNVEIILSDDCSNDSTFEKMKEMVKQYRGSKEVILNRNEKNLGIIEHVNRCVFEVSKGEIIILHAGDDISINDRTSILTDYFLKNEDVFAICSNAIVIDKDGMGTKQFNSNFDENKRTIEGVLNKGTQVFGAAAAYRRDVFSIYGKINNTLRNEEFILSCRAALLGKIGYINKNLISYRNHGGNLSINIKKENTNLKEYCELEVEHINKRINNLVCLKKDFYKYSKDATIENQINVKLKELRARLYLFNESKFIKRLIYFLKNRSCSLTMIIPVFSKNLYLVLRRIQDRKRFWS